MFTAKNTFDIYPYTICHSVGNSNLWYMHIMTEIYVGKPYLLKTKHWITISYQHKKWESFVIVLLDFLFIKCRQSGLLWPSPMAKISFSGIYASLSLNICHFQSWGFCATAAMGLLPDTQNGVLRMSRECRERFPRHRGLAIPTCITARAWRTCRDACRDR